jgi:hypothetical protein
VNGRLFFIKAWTLRNRSVILLNTFLFNDCTISHETSEQHLRSVGKQSAKENLTVNSAAAKIVQSLNKNVFNRMTDLFRNVHALIKKRRPFTDFITIFAAAEFTVKFSFADCLPTDLRCCSEVSWEITDSSLKLEDPVTKTNLMKLKDFI